MFEKPTLTMCFTHTHKKRFKGLKDIGLHIHYLSRILKIIIKMQPDLKMGKELWKNKCKCPLRAGDGSGLWYHCL